MSDDGSFLVIRVWRVAESVPPSKHRFKYSFFYGRPGERLVLFDKSAERVIISTSAGSRALMSLKAVEKLTADFMAEVERIRSESKR